MKCLNSFLSILDTEKLFLVLQVYLPAQVLCYDELYIQLTIVLCLGFLTGYWEALSLLPK